MLPSRTSNQRENPTKSVTGTYRLHGRRGTVLLGRYDLADLSLARAREKRIDARRMVGEGISPAQEKQRQKRRLKEAKSLG